MNAALKKIKFSAELRCIECSGAYPLDSVIYRCAKCGGLLEVSHDMSAVKSLGASDWKNLFTERYRSSEYPYASGVWGKKEWVLPGISLDCVVSLGEGATPLVSVPRFAAEIGLEDVRVKQCGVSHTGSFKDLGMTVLVSHVASLIQSGHKIRAVACASTGDTSAALAAYASARGIPTIVFLPRGKISIAQLVQPIAAGAVVISLDTDFDGCMSVVKKITQRDPSIYLANSMNPLRIEGQKTISFELVQQYGWETPDWVIIPGGNLGNVSALGAGFKMLLQAGIIHTLPRICLAQAQHANPIYLSYLKNFKDYAPVEAKKTYASAIQIGNPVSYPRAVRTLLEFNGIVEQASEDELANAAAQADRAGLFNDPHTGVALACMMKLALRGEIKKNHRVTVISTAHGLKFSEFKTGYHRGELEGVRSRYRNTPVEIPGEISAVERAIEDRLKEIANDARR